MGHVFVLTDQILCLPKLKTTKDKENVPWENLCLNFVSTFAQVYTAYMGRIYESGYCVETV